MTVRLPTMKRAAFVLLVMSVCAPFSGGAATAQDLERVGARLLQEVMPEAERFGPAEGDPIVKRAYRGDEVIGYAFLTSDLPPEEQGYSGPIQSLVGVSVDGIVTGVRPIGYRESIRYELGDFLSEPGFLQQFAGKPVTDRFSLRQDIDGISGVTISVAAMSRTVRDAARRVALAYLPPPEEAGPLTEEVLVGLSWYDMQRRGIAETMSVRQRRRNVIELSVIHLSSEAMGRHLVGTRYEALVEEIEEAGGADEIFLYVVGSNAFAPQLRTGWAIEQAGRTVEVPRDRVVTVGRPSGVLSGESSQFGAILLAREEVDVSSPITFAFDRGRPDLGVFRLDYTVPSIAATPSIALVADATAATGAEADTAPAVGADAAAAAPAVADAEVPAAALTGSEPNESGASDAGDIADAPPDRPDVAEAVQPESVAALDVATPASPVEPSSAAPATPSQVTLTDAADEETYGSDVVSVAWSRVSVILLVVVLAGLAFFTKHPVMKWTSLATTMVLLGWVDGGFLSISHVTGFIWVGLSAVRSDPALLVLTVVTVATVVLWGRVFCGFLCPFGALQDFIDRVVPRRFKRELPTDLHRVAWKAKYVILAVIVGAAALGIQVSLYQYFEPFGTVFFLSTNVLLWVIAGGVLVASVVIPRFYCRYLCPLGALLAVGSVVSLGRIRRVEQCDHCHVCEQKCPTRAITGPSVAFAECVRCNVCEVQLIERNGVCRHEMEDVRSRLVQLRREGVGVP